MITKTIIILWTLLIGIPAYRMLHIMTIDDHVAPAAIGIATFTFLIIWGAGVVPVALIGLLFKRARGSASHAR